MSASAVSADAAAFKQSMRHAYSVLGVTSLGLMFMVVNSSSVNVALPSMSASLNADATTANWFLVAFMLSNTASILVFGRISDMIGRRKIYLVGVAAFVTLSVLAAFAPTAGVMIVLRILQGVAAATMIANTAALVADAFPPSRLAFGLSLNLTGAAVANVIGPTLGGILVTAFGWQSIFLINVPFGVAAFILGLFFLPRERKRKEGVAREGFDYAGATLSALGLAFLLYGINQIGLDGIGSPVVIGSVILGLVLIVAFVLVELRVKHPLVDLSLIRTLARACAYAASFFNSFARAGVTILAVLELQVVYGRSAFEAGLVLMAMAITMVITAPLSGRLMAVVTARTMSAVGGVLLLVAIIALMLTLPTHALGEVIAWLAIVGIGLALFNAPNSTAILAGVPVQRRATANAIRSTLFNSAQTIGTAISLLIITAAGVTNYAQVATGPGVEFGFQIAYGVVGVTALIALVFSIARGGAWVVRRTQLQEELEPSVVVQPE